jgi:ethanolamine transporter EutH
MTTINNVVALIGVIASLLAGGFWLWASIVDVPNNIDTIVGELQRISRINASAAVAATIAAICAAYAFWRQVG